MYMQYSLTEFRKNTKEAFIKALTEDVEIVRGGLVYRLIWDKSKPINTFIVNKTCKVHGTPLLPSGRCTQKGCRYA